MNVQPSESAAAFIASCAATGINDIRLNLSDSDPADHLLSSIRENAAKAYLVPFRAKVTGDADPLFKALNSDVSAVVKRYQAIASAWAPEDLLGIALPEGLHLITRRGPSKRGIRRDTLISMLKPCVRAIREQGHRVVMPVRIDDIQGRVWEPLDFDVYDVEMMMSPRLNRSLKDEAIRQIIDESNKEVWFGRAGRLGGYIIPAVQVKALRKLKGYTRGAEIAFLWSEASNPRFQWSKSGEWFVDTLRGSLNFLNGVGT